MAANRVSVRVLPTVLRSVTSSSSVSASVRPLAGCAARALSTAAVRTSLPLPRSRVWTVPAAPAGLREQQQQQRQQPSFGVRKYSSESSSAPEPKIWTFADVEKVTKDDKSPVVLIDAREPGELVDTGRIPGAINIPVTSAPDSFFIPDEEFEDRFGFARPAKDTDVVFYCKAGVRSRAASGLAKEAGWTKVGNYQGSWLDWAGNGGAVERK